MVYINLCKNKNIYKLQITNTCWTLVDYCGSSGIYRRILDE